MRVILFAPGPGLASDPMCQSLSNGFRGIQVVPGYTMSW